MRVGMCVQYSRSLFYKSALKKFCLQTLRSRSRQRSALPTPLSSPDAPS